jgi:hypothetical protein
MQELVHISTPRHWEKTEVYSIMIRLYTVAVGKKTEVSSIIGKIHLKKILKKIAECQLLGTRQNIAVGGRRHGSGTVCRV